MECERSRGVASLHVCEIKIRNVANDRGLTELELDGDAGRAQRASVHLAPAVEAR